MLYNIKGTEFTITDQTRSYVEKRIKSLDKFFSKKNGARLDIEIEFLKNEDGMYRAEGTLHDHGLEGDFRAEAKGGSPTEAIDIMAGDLKLEIARAKKKVIHEKRRGAARIKDFVRGLRDRF